MIVFHYEAYSKLNPVEIFPVQCKKNTSESCTKILRMIVKFMLEYLIESYNLEWVTVYFFRTFPQRTYCYRLNSFVDETVKIRKADIILIGTCLCWLIVLRKIERLRCTLVAVGFKLSFSTENINHIVSYIPHLDTDFCCWVKLVSSVFERWLAAERPTVTKEYWHVWYHQYELVFSLNNHKSAV